MDESEVFALAAQSANLAEQIKILEGERTKLNDTLVAHMLANSLKTVKTDNLGVTLVQGTRAQVNKQLLLQNGVDADIIEKSSTRSDFCYVRITVAKDDEDASE